MKPIMKSFCGEIRTPFAAVLVKVRILFPGRLNLNVSPAITKLATDCERHRVSLL
jgi:hypothetical protein